MAGTEPTVTINTKEALADVFGMYNSPDKTKVFPGSKHAPVKKIEPVTPIVPPRLTFARENENANAKTPSSRFSLNFNRAIYSDFSQQLSARSLMRMLNRTESRPEPRYSTE